MENSGISTNIHGNNFQKNDQVTQSVGAQNLAVIPGINIRPWIKSLFFGPDSPKVPVLVESRAENVYRKVAEESFPDVSPKDPLSPKEQARKNICKWAEQHIRDYPDSQDEVNKTRDDMLLFLGNDGIITECMDLSGCTRLTSLPEGLNMAENLKLSHCTGLTSLPEGLQVAGELDLSYCTGLTALPKGLKAGKGIDLSRCTGLTSLPEDMNPGWNLYLNGCTGLTSLPKNLKVPGVLNVSRCTELIALPEGLQVGKNLNASGCTGLTTLPKGMKVGWSLYLSGCTNLVSLPNSLKVRGNMELNGCVSLITLPEGLQVGGNLELSCCIGLTTLPVGVVVGKSMNLSGCTGLISLSEGLKVGEHINLFDCTGLTSLPEVFQVGRNIDLSHCIRLTSLPNGFIHMGYGDDGHVRIVDLTGCGLSESVIMALRDANAPGIRFHFSMRPQHAGVTFETLDEGIKFWEEAVDIEKEDGYQSLQQLSLLNDGNLRAFLARLADTAEYNNGQGKQFLAYRIINLLDAMEKNAAIRESALDQIHGGLISCDDRIIWTLDQIEQRIKLQNAEKALFEGQDQDGKQYKALIKGYLLLEKVQKEANRAKELLTFVDEIELFLAFQIRLKDKLNLPVDTTSMIFRRCAGVTDEQIDEAGNRIIHDYKESDLNAYLDAMPTWQKYLRSRKVTGYANMPVISILNVPESANINNCLILQDKPQHPVLYKGGVYEYHALKKQYINGNRDISGKPTDWEMVKRIEKRE